MKKWRFFAFFPKLSKVIGHLFCNFATDLADGDFLSRIVRACSSPRKPDPSAKSHEVTKKIGQARSTVRPTSVQRRERDTFAGCSSVVGSWRLLIASCVKNFVMCKSGLMLFNPDSSQANEDTFLEVWGYFFFKKVCNTAHFASQIAKSCRFSCICGKIFVILHAFLLEWILTKEHWHRKLWCSLQPHHDWTLEPLQVIIGNADASTYTSGVGCLLFPIRPVPSFAPSRGSGSPHFFMKIMTLWQI